MGLEKFKMAAVAMVTKAQQMLNGNLTALRETCGEN
jgi:hypothetical protein